MLQQTQVSRVVERWGVFLDRFPDPPACAAAPAAAVIDEWQGLGYNRRAINLHRAAEAITDRHGGTVPASLDALLALPGVGPYTARAVLVFAFERDVGVVDVNIARLLARWDGVERTPLGSPGACRRARPGRRDLGIHPGAVRPRRNDLPPARNRDATQCPVAAVVQLGRAWPRSPPAWPPARADSRGRTARAGAVSSTRCVAGRCRSTEIAATAGWPDDPDRAGVVAASLDQPTDWRSAVLDGGLDLPGRVPESGSIAPLAAECEP